MMKEIDDTLGASAVDKFIRLSDHEDTLGDIPQAHLRLEALISVRACIAYAR